MKTEETMSIRDLMYEICKIYDIPQEIELKKLTDEFENIRQKLLELTEEDKVKDHNMRNAARTSNTMNEIKVLVDQVANEEINMNEFIEKVISAFKYLIKHYENNNRS